MKFGSRGYGHSGISSLGLMSDAKDLEWQWYIKLLKRKKKFTKIFTIFFQFFSKTPSKNSETHAPRTTVVDTAKILAPEGQGCPRCGGAVFAAELVLAKGREWHRKCFKCKDCTKTLDSIIACDGPDKDVYCRTCYGKV